MPNSLLDSNLPLISVVSPRSPNLKTVITEPCRSIHYLCDRVVGLHVLPHMKRHEHGYSGLPPYFFAGVLACFGTLVNDIHI